MSPYKVNRDLKGKPIIDIQKGRNLGALDDVRFDPATLKPMAITMNKGGLLKRTAYFFPADAVHVWGQDVILVQGEGYEVDTDRENQAHGMSLSDQIRGHYVVSSDGLRVGQIDDIEVDEAGNPVAVDLSQVFLKDSPLAEHKRIPMAAVKSLGRDVMIVDLGQLMGPVENGSRVERAKAVEPIEPLEDTQPVNQPDERVRDEHREGRTVGGVGDFPTGK